MKTIIQNIINDINNLNLSGVHAYYQYDSLFVSFNYPENSNVINIEFDWDNNYQNTRVAGVDFANTNQETTELELDSYELPKLNQVMKTLKKYM